MATAKKKGSTTARKRPAKPRRRRATPATATAAPEPAAPPRRWYEHPLLSPVVWTVIAGTLTLIWTYGEEMYEDFRDQVVLAPEPFVGDGVGILLARLENDPDNEFSSRVRAALERQFPISADGSSSVEVSLYPKKLELPEHGRLSENIVRASAEGRTWLEEQKADLLIWGRALPTTKMLELRILTREPLVKSKAAQPELYPIRIPAEFSDQIGGALAGMVAGAGANAWSQRGGYLTPSRSQDLYGWLSRLNTLKDELPDTLDENTLNELRRSIKMARAQIGGALLADGNSALAPQVLNDLFPSQDPNKTEGILTTHPFMAAEIIGDVVSQFSDVMNQIGPNDAATLKDLISKTTASFDENYANGTFGQVEYAYLSGLLAKLSGDIEAFTGASDEAKESYAKASEHFETVLAELPPEQDAITRARLQRYLGETQLALARQSSADKANALLDKSIANLSDAQGAVSPDDAPRDAVRIGYFLASAELARAEWDVDAAALKRSIQHLDAVVSTLASNQRSGEADGLSVQLAGLQFSDAIFASGTKGAEESLALVERLRSSLEDKGSPETLCSSMTGDDRETCIRYQENLAVREEAALQRGTCMGHLAAGYRFDADGEKLSPPAQKHLQHSFKACEAAARTFLELEDIPSYAEVKLYLANGLRIAGERSKNKSQLQDAIAAADAAKDRLGTIQIPNLEAQAALSKAGALRELGVLEGKPELLREAKQLQLSALPVYSGKDFAVQRTFTEVQLAQTLVDLAEIEDAGDELSEASELLSKAQDRYAKGGAKLAADDATRELNKIKDIQAKLGAN